MVLQTSKCSSDHHLATLDNENARLSVEFNVDQGTGYLVGSNDEGYQ